MSSGGDWLSRLARPLESASSNDYRALPRVKNLGRTILSILDDLPGESGGAEQFRERLAALFGDFDALPLPVRRDRVERALKLIVDARQQNLWPAEAATAAESPKEAAKKTPAGPAPRERELAARAARAGEGDLARAMSELDTDVTYVKGVGPHVARVLGKLGIEKVGDLLWHLPHRYEDRRNVRKIADLQGGESAVVRGKILGVGRAGRRVYEAVLGDETGTLSLKWFRFSEKQLRDRLEKAGDVFVTGEVKKYRGKMEITHPEIEDAGEDSEGREEIVPVYPLTEGLHNRRVRAIVGNALDKFGNFLQDAVPNALLGEPLPTLADALRELHRPDAGNDLERLNAQATLYHQRLRLQEAFYLQMGLVRSKREQAAEQAAAFDPEPALLTQLLESLPFKPTGAQRRVIAEIASDLSQPRVMNRLLQGDVGSGKTLVAAAAASLVIAGGHQVALMAPTEILAEQHYRSLQQLLAPLEVRLALLTGSQKVSTTTVNTGRVMHEIAEGAAQLVVGTHAIIQEGVKFKNLSLAIIDEQHRFGVAQRADLKDKGEHVHFLVMTATPIPRTLTMTIYGDLSVSLLDEMPPGRTPVFTRVYPAKGRPEVWRLVERELAQGRQAYVVYPLVAESEKMDLRDAIAAAEELQNGIFANYRVGIVHGQMKSQEKDDVLARFRKGEIHVLVSTTVIEVGIDVPNASVMVVEHAERFGLSQLHQLRGRVGRGAARSYCYLVAGEGVRTEANARLKVMEQVSDGFIIAEEDLRIRGPGEFMGTRQSGLPEFRVLDLIRDRGVIAKAREAAEEIFAKDPELKLPEHRTLAWTLQHHWRRRGRFVSVG